MKKKLCYCCPSDNFAFVSEQLEGLYWSVWALEVELLQLGLGCVCTDSFWQAIFLCGCAFYCCPSHQWLLWNTYVFFLFCGLVVVSVKLASLFKVYMIRKNFIAFFLSFMWIKKGYTVKNLKKRNPPMILGPKYSQFVFWNGPESGLRNRVVTSRCLQRFVTS